MSRYPELSDFSLAFADAYRGFMKETRVTGKQIAEKLDRNIGYVSERINGKRPLDTADVDALAMLAGEGWTGRKLIMELARRAQQSLEGDELAPVTDLMSRREAGQVLTERYFDDNKAVASEHSEDRGEDDGYDA